MVAVGFAIGYFAYRFILPIAGSLTALILALVLPIIWWLFASGSVAEAINAIIPIGIAPVESRDFGGFMLAILLQQQRHQAHAKMDASRIERDGLTN